MMNLVIGYGGLLIGLAYSGLGLLSAWESFSLYRYRGWSRFGIGFSLMAASCGPHHLLHGWHVLHGAAASWPTLGVTLLGLPAGLAFVGLRFEAMLGGRGDRSFASPIRHATLLAAGFGAAVGAFTAWAVAQPPLPASPLCTADGLAGATGMARFLSAGFLTNAFVAVTYGMVGWYLADVQVRRRLRSGAWSVSGAALAGVFFSCALMHLVHGISVDGTNRDALLAFDLLGVPASVYFLWVVKRVHNDSVVDWNRRPLVGVAAAPERSSPWSSAGA